MTPDQLIGAINAEIPEGWIRAYVDKRNRTTYWDRRNRTNEFAQWLMPGLNNYKRRYEILPAESVWEYYVVEGNPIPTNIIERIARRRAVFLEWFESQVTESGGVRTPLYAWLIERAGNPVSGSSQPTEATQSVLLLEHKLQTVKTKLSDIIKTL